MDTWPFTVDLLVVLATAAALAIVGQRVRLAVIPAYLITGALIGPHALGWVHSPHSLQAIGDLAIILLLFGIGLELNLVVMRQNLSRMLLAGILSTAASVLVGWPVALAFGMSAPAALAASMALSLSSTAVVLRTLGQHHELSQTRGRLAFSILILQDLLVLLMLLALPALRAWSGHGTAAAGAVTLPATHPTLGAELLAATSAWRPVGGAGWIEILVDLVILASLVVVGRVLLPRLLAETARQRSAESMMILSVAVAIGAAVITQILGFTAALGAFLAGFLLSATPFRYQLRSQVAPLRNLFIAVFFTVLGMQLDPAAALRWWWVILAGVAAMTVIKTLTIGGTAWALGASGSVAAAVGLSLAQGGEFSLVLIQAGQGARLLSRAAAVNLIAVVIVSLILTPAMIRLGFRTVVKARWGRSAPWIRRRPLTDPGGPDATPQRRRRVIIAGYGVVGRAVADRLEKAGVETVLVEMNPATVQRQSTLGRRIIYGDISAPDVLEAAGIHEAAALVVTVPDQEAAVRACAVARSLEPGLFIAARTSMLSQGMLASRAGADHVTIEEVATADSMQKAVVDWLEAIALRAAAPAAPLPAAPLPEERPAQPSSPAADPPSPPAGA